MNIPEAPDLSGEIDQFENPTAVVDGPTIANTAEEIMTTKQNIEELGILELVEPLIEELQEELGGGGDAGAPNIEEKGGAKGVVRLNSTCRGWGESVEPDPDTTGKIELTSTIRKGRFLPVIWGPATRCQYVVPLGDRTIQVGLDALVNMELGGLLGVSETLEGRLLTFQFGGSATIGGVVQELLFSFRIRTNRSFEFAVAGPNGGSFVVSVNGGELQLGVRGSNGEWGCDFEENVCTGPDGSFNW